MSLRLMTKKQTIERTADHYEVVNGKVVKVPGTLTIIPAEYQSVLNSDTVYFKDGNGNHDVYQIKRGDVSVWAREVPTTWDVQSVTLSISRNAAEPSGSSSPTTVSQYYWHDSLTLTAISQTSERTAWWTTESPAVTYNGVNIPKYSTNKYDFIINNINVNSISVKPPYYVYVYNNTSSAAFLYLNGSSDYETLNAGSTKSIYTASSGSIRIRNQNATIDTTVTYNSPTYYTINSSSLSTATSINDGSLSISKTSDGWSTSYTMTNNKTFPIYLTTMSGSIYYTEDQEDDWHDISVSIYRTINPGQSLLVYKYTGGTVWDENLTFRYTVGNLSSTFTY